MAESETPAARRFIALHRRAIVITILIALLLVAGAVVWFQPQKLVIDRQVNEALPGAVAGAGGEDGAAGNGGGPAPEGDSASAETNPAASPGRTLASGQFQSLEHKTAGRASILELADGTRYLRFDDLATSNGPDLRVYLSEIPASDDWHAYGERFTDLGALKGNLGDQNYAIPAGVDLARYKSAVIWCRRFTVGFGVAPLR
jgi:Electron transfer DM13